MSECYCSDRRPYTVCQSCYTKQVGRADEAEAALATVTKERDTLADLLGDALAHTPETYSGPILEILDRKAGALAAKGEEVGRG